MEFFKGCSSTILDGFHYMCTFQYWIYTYILEINESHIALLDPIPFPYIRFKWTF